MSVNHNKPLFLSNGTQVRYFKHTSKGNIQVIVPDSDPIGAADPKRIFRPDGTHYKDALDVTLTNNAPASATATAAVETGGPVDPNQPMFLNDGTPVTLSKVTRRGRIQVKLPDTHAAAAGQENGWLFEKADGSRYKGRDPQLTLTNTAPSATSVATADDTGDFALVSGGNIIEDGFADMASARQAAIDEIMTNQGGVGSVDIVQTVQTKVGSVTID